MDRNNWNDSSNYRGHQIYNAGYGSGGGNGGGGGGSSGDNWRRHGTNGNQYPTQYQNQRYPQDYQSRQRDRSDYRERTDRDRRQYNNYNQSGGSGGGGGRPHRNNKQPPPPQPIPINYPHTQIFHQPFAYYNACQELLKAEVAKSYPDINLSNNNGPLPMVLVHQIVANPPRYQQLSPSQSSPPDTPPGESPADDGGLADNYRPTASKSRAIVNYPFPPAVGPGENPSNFKTGFYSSSMPASTTAELHAKYQHSIRVSQLRQQQASYISSNPPPILQNYYYSATQDFSNWRSSNSLEDVYSTFKASPGYQNYFSSQSPPGTFTPPPLSTMKPQGVFHNWDLRLLTAEEIQIRSAELIAQIKALFDITANATTLSYDTVLKPLLEAHRYSFLMGSMITFPRHVHECPEIRKASSDATKALDVSSVEMSMRKDVFEKLVEYKDNFSEKDNLRPEYARCLDRIIHNGRRNGLHLSQEIRDEVKAIKKRTSELTLQFSRNLAEENSSILFDPEDLGGMPYSFIQNLPRDPESGKCKVSLRYPHFFPITRKCHVPETRRILETAYQSKCLNENTEILEEIIDLRHKEATLLGYPNHATYSQDMLMVKNPEKVNEFLTDLIRKLQPLWEEEKNQMLELKKIECEKYGYEFNDKLDFWDFRYYLCLIEEEKYAVDQELIMEYFPLDIVTKGMLSIYEDLLSLKFTYLPNADKWHDDVKVYQVNDKESKELMGYFYLDLFPREGKFGHACCVPLQPGSLDPDGIKQPAISAMLTNFNRPKDGKPSLLDHKEVETYFHEFGHLMHTICSRAETAIFFGTRVETDFVEAPSQMLENWAWEKEPLQRMSSHYETNVPLPDDLIDRLSHSQKACAGALNLRQLVLAQFDQEIHLNGHCNTKEIYAKVLKEIMGLDAIPGTNMPANFNHLCVGYSGRYYSYLWSEVYSMDMYKTVFQPNGILNPDIGKKYRECILEPGGSVDAMTMLINFLGREPRNDSFLESKGLSHSL